MGYWQNNPPQRQTTTAPHNFAPEVGIGGGNPVDVDQQNAIVLAWQSKVRSKLRSSARWFSDGKTKSFVIRGPQREGKLANSIQSKNKKEFGLIESVTYTFERHGVFVHKGVGRGYVKKGEFVTRTAKKRDPKKIGKDRVAVEWFNPVLDQYLPELADRLAKVNADAVINSFKMKIH